MKILNKCILSFALITSISTYAQEATVGEPSTIQGLLQLVEQGRTTEQGVNAKREADFLADKNKQAAKLAAEKRELARQEKIADQLEAEYKKNDAILGEVKTNLIFVFFQRSEHKFTILSRTDLENLPMYGNFI